MAINLPGSARGVIMVAFLLVTLGLDLFLSLLSFSYFGQIPKLVRALLRPTSSYELETYMDVQYMSVECASSAGVS